MKAVRPVIPTNGVLSLHMRSVGSHGTSGWGVGRKEERKEGKAGHSAVR